MERFRKSEHRIDRDATETIHVTTKDAVTGTEHPLCVVVPRVTFHRTREKATAPIRTKRPR